MWVADFVFCPQNGSIASGDIHLCLWNHKKPAKDTIQILKQLYEKKETTKTTDMHVNLKFWVLEVTTKSPFPH